MDISVITRTGDNHCEQNMPSQDSYLCTSTSNGQLFVIADGHGAEEYCRSDKGSLMACIAAAKALDEIGPSAETPEKIKEEYDALVRKDIEENPFSEDELALIADNPVEYAYGTTCLCVLVRDESADLFQIGDGQIHLLRTDGSYMKAPEEDENCYLNYTSSLVYDREEAIRCFRREHYDEKPAAVIMFSDGYRSIFSKPYALCSVIGKEETVIEEQVLKGFHGDDMTVIVACDEETVTSEQFTAGISMHHDEWEKEFSTMKTKQEISAVSDRIDSLNEFLTITGKLLERYRNMGEEKEQLDKLTELYLAKAKELQQKEDYLEKLRNTI